MVASLCPFHFFVLFWEYIVHHSWRIKLLIFPSQRKSIIHFNHLLLCGTLQITDRYDEKQWEVSDKVVYSLYIKPAKNDVLTLNSPLSKFTLWNIRFLNNHVLQVIRKICCSKIVVRKMMFYKSGNLMELEFLQDYFKLLGGSFCFNKHDQDA